jgi:hypothetical protein
MFFSIMGRKIFISPPITNIMISLYPYLSKILKPNSENPRKPRKTPKCQSLPTTTHS